MSVVLEYLASKLVSMHDNVIVIQLLYKANVLFRLASLIMIIPMDD